MAGMSPDMTIDTDAPLMGWVGASATVYPQGGR